MDLFSDQTNPDANLLTRDGIVNYYGAILSYQEADACFQHLLTSISWMNDQAVIRGKRFTTKRKIAWHGDKPFQYTYSNTTKQALPWTEELLRLKSRVEQCSGEVFNSCLLNLYHSGEEGMAWHSDAEKELQKQGAIASVSLGAERKFMFKHKQTKESVAVFLEHGSLLIMKGLTQSYWLHRLPPTKKIHQPRINLTFRTMVDCNKFREPKLAVNTQMLKV